VRSFTDLDALVGAVPFTVVNDLRVVDTGRGTEALFRDKLPQLLTGLADRARVASIEASSAIEGVVVENRTRAAAILAGHSDELRTRSEQELAGYRAALDYLYREPWEPLNAGLLLHLHRLLFAYTEVPGGEFEQTPYYVDETISRYTAAQQAGRHHPVLLVGLFALDLLTIHPFVDGNGRITRALTNALLQEAGYGVTRYVSLETMIADSSDAYYAALLASTDGWHESRHDPWPWLRYFVTVVRRSYEEFGTVTAAARSGGSKQDRVRDYVRHHAPPTFRIADIRVALPGISDQTIRLALDSLKGAGEVEADGVGRAATWTRHVHSERQNGAINRSRGK
jgi:Fic family protein